MRSSSNFSERHLDQLATNEHDTIRELHFQVTSAQDNLGLGLAAPEVVAAAWFKPQLNHLVGRQGALILSIVPAVVIGALTGPAVFALVRLTRFVRRHLQRNA